MRGETDAHARAARALSARPVSAGLRTMVEEAEPTEHALAAIVAAVGVALAADRCWLYAREPTRRRGIAAVRWLRTAGTADVPAGLHAWAAEPPDLAERDPLFARALAGAPIDTVDDTGAGGVDRDMEQALGHRAFVHLNLHVDGVLWATLQPGMTRDARHWRPHERALLLELRPALARTVAALVVRLGDRLTSVRLIRTADAPPSRPAQ